MHGRSCHFFLCHYLEEGYSTTGDCLCQKQKVYLYMYLETRAIFSNQRTGVGLGTARRRTVDLNPWII